jgi:TonB family protein
VRVALAVLLAHSVIAAGQSPGAKANQVVDSASCAAKLNAPSPDSEIVELSVFVQPFDTTRTLPDKYREILGEGLREMLAPPKPLPVDTYDRVGVAGINAPNSGYATVTLQSAYRLTLHRDGHLTNVRAVGGVRNAAFDRAVVAAFLALDTSGLIPPPAGFDYAFDHDALDLQIAIAPTFVTRDMSFTGESPHRPGVKSLLRMRLGVRRVDKEVAVRPGGPYPRYPPSMRAAGTEGSVLLEFRVNADGSYEPESLQVLRSTSREFLQAVLDVLPRLKFFPLEVAGCVVPSLVSMPFVFGLSR